MNRYLDNLQILGAVAADGRNPVAQQHAKSALGKILIGGVIGAVVGGGAGALLFPEHLAVGLLVGGVGGGGAGAGLGMYLASDNITVARASAPVQKGSRSEQIVDALTPALSAVVQAASTPKPAPAAAAKPKAAAPAAADDSKPPAGSPLLFSLAGDRR